MKERIIRAAASDAVTPLQRENRELARTAAREGIVLLKNEGALPVKPGRIALYGAGASRTVKGGTGSGEVNERHAVTILEGLELAGYEIASYGWIGDFERECREAEKAWLALRGAQGGKLTWRGRRAIIKPENKGGAVCADERRGSGGMPGAGRLL